MPSSPLQISTLPTSTGVPSGHLPPLVMAAAKAMPIVVLPVPGAPARRCSFPLANQSRHSQSIGSGVYSAADLRMTEAKVLRLAVQRSRNLQGSEGTTPGANDDLVRLHGAPRCRKGWR
jgi:hypothetical protein